MTRPLAPFSPDSLLEEPDETSDFPDGPAEEETDDGREENEEEADDETDYVPLRDEDGRGTLRRTAAPAVGTRPSEASMRHIHFLDPPRRSVQLSSVPSMSELDPSSALYDWELVQDRLEQLRVARKTGDLELSVFLMRTGLHRDLGGMMNPELYASENPGAMRLISEYIEEVTEHLTHIADSDWHFPHVMVPATSTGSSSSLAALPVSAKHSFFLSLQRSFGRTALLLSGGATLGLTHLGVLKVLLEERLLPRVISGASVGSIMAAIVCTRTDSEIPLIFEPGSLKLQSFTGPDEKLSSILHRFATEGVFYDVEVLLQTLRHNIGELTFQEAFNRTRRILNVTVSPGSSFEMPRVLNYLTSPSVIVWSAVAASCAVPLIYNSAPLLAKDKAGNVIPWNPTGHRWIDGSVENDLPMVRISELFGVNHFLVSQVNPHVVPFLSTDLAPSFFSRTFSSLADALKNELAHRLGQVADLGVAPTLMNRTVGLLKQRYTGDVTVVPDVGIKDYLKLIVNPTDEDLTSYRERGERAVMAKIPQIRNRLAIELAIDDILYRLRLQRFQAHPSPTNSASAVHISSKAKEHKGRSLVGLSRLAMDTEIPAGLGPSLMTAPGNEFSTIDLSAGPRTPPVKIQMY
jgi:predicted acylesterase/phospholipase RssA